MDWERHQDCRKQSQFYKVFLQCSDTVGWVTGRASGLKKNWVLVCWWWRFYWSFACLIAPVVTTTSIILSSSKVQNGDILVPPDAGSPGKWLLVGRQEGPPACKRFVGSDDLTGALHVLQVQWSPPLLLSLAPVKLASPIHLEKWPLKRRERERERERENDVLVSCSL